MFADPFGCQCLTSYALLRFHIPLIEPDVRIGRIRLSDRFHVRLTQATPDGAFGVFTKTVRLKKYGHKRLVIVHESAQLQDAPRFLLTDALHWESGRIIQTWSYRWAAEVFHE